MPVSYADFLTNHLAWGSSWGTAQNLSDSQNIVAQALYEVYINAGALVGPTGTTIQMVMDANAASSNPLKVNFTPGAMLAAGDLLR